MPREKCGLLAISGTYDSKLGDKLFWGISSLQHRGQESAGVAIFSETTFLISGRGMVADVFAPYENLSKYGGIAGIAHVRYGHEGETDKANQPIHISSPMGDLYLAFNGSITNYDELIGIIDEDIKATDDDITDIACIGYVLSTLLRQERDIVSGLSKLLGIICGAYSIILMFQNAIYSLRDRYGFRPLCYGVTQEGQYIFASESCAIERLGATVAREVDPGEIVYCDETGIHFDQSRCSEVPSSLCCFEYFYFANPVSRVGGCLVQTIRCQAGRMLALRAPVHCDLVIGVPDSGVDAAKGYAKELGLPYGNGFCRDERVPRTFIVPNQKERERLVRAKLAVIPEVVKDKEIVVVDDSIVRGTTCKHIAHLLRQAGAKAIHLRICSPKFVCDCPYGTDIGEKEGLIAHRRTTEEIAICLGVDSLGYLEPEDVDALICTFSSHSRVCKACFDGVYPDGK